MTGAVTPDPLDVIANSFTDQADSGIVTTAEADREARAVLAGLRDAGLDPGAPALRRAATRLVAAVDADVQIGLLNARSTTGDAALDLADQLGYQMGSAPISHDRRLLARMAIPLSPCPVDRLELGDRIVAAGDRIEVAHVRPAATDTDAFNGLVDVYGCTGDGEWVMLGNTHRATIVWIERP